MTYGLMNQLMGPQGWQPGYQPQGGLAQNSLYSQTPTTGVDANSSSIATPQINGGPSQQWQQPNSTPLSPGGGHAPNPLMQGWGQGSGQQPNMQQLMQILQMFGGGGLMGMLGHGNMLMPQQQNPWNSNLNLMGYGQ